MVRSITHPRIGLYAWVAPAFLAFLTNCTLPGTDRVQFAVVVNETDTDVVVFLDYPDGETSIMEIGPGERDASNFSGPDGCAPATLIARDRSGVEVDRMELPFCIGDRWEIQNELP